MTNAPGDTGGVVAAIARLAEHSASLSRLDDEYLRLINRAEEALRGLNIGLRLTVLIDTTDIDEVGDNSFRMLAFDKVAGGWRLSVETGLASESADEWESTPLASCDRDLRFDVFADGHLEKLIIKGVQALQHAVERREHHLGPSKALVTAIEQARPARAAKGGKP